MHLFTRLIIALLGITELSAAQRADKIVIQGNPAGTQTVQTDPTGLTRAEYSYYDRGRGDHIIATWKVDAAGIPTEYEGRGNDYMKAPVQEKFESQNGKARWKNRSEQGEQSVTGQSFYFPANAPPEFTGVLARALLKAPDHRLLLLPGGEAKIDEIGKLNVGEKELTQYRITGLSFIPQPIRLDANGDTAAIVSSWFSTLEAPLEHALPWLQEAQQAADNAWSKHLAPRAAGRTCSKRGSCDSQCSSV
jgi:hypothetical protein